MSTPPAGVPPPPVPEPPHYQTPGQFLRNVTILVAVPIGGLILIVFVLKRFHIL